MEEVNVEIPLDTPIGELGAKYLVEFGHEVGIVDARSSENGRRRHLRLHLEGVDVLPMLDVPVKRRVGNVVTAMSGRRPTRVFQLPPGRVVETKRHMVEPRSWVLLVPALVLITLAIVAPLDAWLVFLMMAGGLGTLAAALTAGGRRAGTGGWAFVSQGRRQTLDELRPPPPLPERHVADVDALKLEYGRLLSDIAYRIEHPSLFDPHEKHTKEFTLALLEWDDTHERLDDDAQMKLSVRVVSTFRAARAHAERIGMDHLPAEVRERAGTALKSARLATDEQATDAERTAALGRMIRILDALALYYLPTGLEARDAIEGRPIRQLPGRSSS